MAWLDAHHDDNIISKHDDDDLVTLMVGGTVELKVNRHVLTQHESSMLAVLFSGRWSLQVDDEGRMVIPQPDHLFVPLVNCLKSRYNHNNNKAVVAIDAPSPETSFDGNEQVFGDFLRLVDYYGLYDVLYPVRILPLATTDHQQPALSPLMYVPTGVRMQQVGPMQRYILVSTQPHSRVSSFDIVFDEDYYADDGEYTFGVGWVDPRHLPKDSVSMECFRATGSLTGWYFRGPRMCGGTVTCNLNEIKCTGVFENDDTKKYKMTFDEDIPADFVAVLGGVGKWRVGNVTLEPCASLLDGQ